MEGSSDYGNQPRYGQRSHDEHPEWTQRDYRSNFQPQYSDEHAAHYGSRYEDQHFRHQAERHHAQHGHENAHEHDRNWVERTSDEVRSWFGDNEAERRRTNDFRYDQPGHR